MPTYEFLYQCQQCGYDMVESHDVAGPWADPPERRCGSVMMMASRLPETSSEVPALDMPGVMIAAPSEQEIEKYAAGGMMKTELAYWDKIAKQLEETHAKYAQYQKQAQWPQAQKAAEQYQILLNEKQKALAAYWQKRKPQPQNVLPPSESGLGFGLPKQKLQNWVLPSNFWAYDPGDDGPSQPTQTAPAQPPKPAPSPAATEVVIDKFENKRFIELGG